MGNGQWVAVSDLWEYKIPELYLTGQVFLVLGIEETTGFGDPYIEAKVWMCERLMIGIMTFESDQYHYTLLSRISNAEPHT